MNSKTEKTLTRKQVLNKVKKLLALSKGTNFEGEVSAALNMARQLLAKYDLSMSDIETIEYNKQEPRFKNSNINKGHWQPYLSIVIAKYCNCHSFGQDGKLMFIGMPAELELCNFTFNLVAKQIDKMMRKKRRELRVEREQNGKNRKNSMRSAYYTRGYSMGIIKKIDERLEAQLTQEEIGTALVLVKHPKVNAWCKNNLVNGKSQPDKTSSEKGFNSGYKDGDSILFNKGIKGGTKRGQIGYD